MTYKQKKRLSLLILLVGLPIYIFFAMEVFVRLSLEGTGRWTVWLELAVIAVVGVLWPLPFKQVFKGVGQADPDAKPDE